MKIIRLTASNFKRLVAVEIKPDGHVVTITGKNGAGKSCVLDAIPAALGGKAASPKKPIRDGETKAVVVLETEKYVITRQFTGAGSHLEVTTAQGYKVSSPQALLNTFVGDIAFDPLAFIRQTEKQQRQILIELLGVDLGAHDAEIEKCRSYRAELLAEKKRRSDELAQLRKYPDAPAEEVSVAEIAEQLRRVDAHNTTRGQLTASLDAMVAKQRDLLAELVSLEKKIAQAKDTLADTPQQDPSDLRQRLATAEDDNRCVRANRRYDEVAALVEQCTGLIRESHESLEAAEAAKAGALAQMKMPVDGLTVTDDGVAYDGIPLAQVNHAKQLEISMAIQMALNPTLRVMLIDGNALDTETKQRIEQMAVGQDYQLWVEQTDESGKIGVVIEDGSVRAGL